MRGCTAVAHNTLDPLLPWQCGRGESDLADPCNLENHPDPAESVKKKKNKVQSHMQDIDLKGNHYQKKKKTKLL